MAPLIGLRTLFQVLAIATGFVVCLSMGITTASAKTFGFVVTTWDAAVYQTRFWDECPDGTAIGNDEYWLNGLSPSDRGRLTGNGLIETDKRRAVANHRGPHSEDVCWNPTAVQDPPLREAQSKVSYGLNLDGTDDGHATANTCAHEKFIGPNGEPGIDNQLYRVVGCAIAWRSSGYVDRKADDDRRDYGRGLLLIEVDGVDDLRNGSDVQVAFYMAADVFKKDTSGNILPGASYRIANTNGVPLYGAVVHGKIVDGVLQTVPADVELPLYSNSGFANISMRGMRLSLNVTPDGRTAKGLVAGFYDLDSWWHHITNIEFRNASNDFNCPDMWEAAHRLADGAPDPKTGKCTAISSAFAVEAVSAFVIHPVAEKKASGASGLTQTARGQ